MNKETKLGFADHICHNLPYGLCSLSRDFEILWANKKFYDLTGLKGVSLLGDEDKKLAPQSRKSLFNFFLGKGAKEKIYFQNKQGQVFCYGVKIIYVIPHDHITITLVEFESLAQKLALSLESLSQEYVLTHAEAEVGRLLALGLSCQEISNERQTSMATVRAQLRQLREKMNVSSQVEVVTKIYAHCLLEIF